MEFDPDILAIARALLARHGARALLLAEAHSAAHSAADEREGETVWREVAAAIRAITAAPN